MSKMFGNPFDPTRPSSDRRRRGRAGAGPRRRRGRNESWRYEPDLYPAATVLTDLECIGPDPLAAAAVLARFAVLQLILQSSAKVLAGEALLEEYEVALSYLDEPSICAPAEYEALRSALDQARTEPTPTLATTLVAAGTAAAARGHNAGARALCLAAFELAESRLWPAQGAAAARELAALASTTGDPRATRHWKRRAHSLAQQALDEAPDLPASV